MFGVAMGATDARLMVDEGIKQAVLGEGEDRPRALKVTVDPTAEKLTLAETLPATSSLSEDFSAVAKVLDETTPCLVLVRLTESEEGEGEKWAMVGWTPSASPVKLRMLCASSRRTLRDEFSKLKFKEYSITERDEMTLDQFEESTRQLTDKDRNAAMTFGELEAQDVSRQIAEERATQPKQLAGLVAVQVKLLPSFEQALERLVASQVPPAAPPPADADDDMDASPSSPPPRPPPVSILGRFVGEDLDGEVLEGAALPSELKGRLPNEEPCYVLQPLRSGDGLLLISWLPEFSEVRKRMKCSTFKASLLAQVRKALGDRFVAQAEVTAEDDLEDKLADAAPTSPSAAAEEEQMAPAPTGPKPPPGGVALPGMGAANMVLPNAILVRGEKVVKKEPEVGEGYVASQPPKAPEPKTKLFDDVEMTKAEPSGPKEFLTLLELTKPEIWQARGVDAGRREEWLSDAEFLETFQTSKEDFAKLPKWKRDQKKKDKGLF